jgi:hypothetical protein
MLVKCREAISLSCLAREASLSARRRIAVWSYYYFLTELGEGESTTRRYEDENAHM